MNDQLPAQLEATLFVATGPLALGKLSKLLGCSKAELGEALNFLKERYNSNQSGLQIISQGKEVVLGTKPEFAEAAGKLLKEQTQGDLTRPQLETLTIIAYRGPVSKVELEMIRGVNCSLIVRNLLMRGLITEKIDQKIHVPVYAASFEFIRHLGLQGVSELPDYESLSKHTDIEAVLE